MSHALPMEPASEHAALAPLPRPTASGTTSRPTLEARACARTLCGVTLVVSLERRRCRAVFLRAKAAENEEKLMHGVKGWELSKNVYNDGKFHKPMEVKGLPSAL